MILRRRAPVSITLLLVNVVQASPLDRCHSLLSKIIDSPPKANQTRSTESWQHLEIYRKSPLSSTEMTPEGIARVLLENRRKLYHYTDFNKLFSILGEGQLRWKRLPEETPSSRRSKLYPDKVFFTISDRKEFSKKSDSFSIRNKAPEDGAWKAGHPKSNGKVDLEFDPDSLIGNKISHWLVRGGQGFGEKHGVFAETDTQFSKLMVAEIQEKKRQVNDNSVPWVTSESRLGIELVASSPYRFKRKSVTVFMSQSQFLALSQKQRSLLKTWKIKVQLREDLNKYRVPQKGLTLAELKKCSNPSCQSGFMQLLKWHNNLEAGWITLKNYFEHRVTTSVSEGINNVIKAIKRRAYGYKNMEYYRLKIMQVCGYLNSKFIAS